MRVSFSHLPLILALAILPVWAQDPISGPGVGHARYATDAYPGFDSEDEMVKPERKTPHWWWFLCGGPSCDDAAQEFAHAEELVKSGSYAKAAGSLDALVRQWPTAPEAWKAQQRLADLLFEQINDYEEAFREYRYLLDFYSLQCDFASVADRLYQVAGVLKREGKAVMFVRFENTVDVRRAYETCVLRAPGAAWVPEAMMTIAQLRIDEGKFTEAVKVYENLRNLHPDAPEAKLSLAREAMVRMDILKDRGYNRARCRDTADFLRMALRNGPPEESLSVRNALDSVLVQLENDAYASARFYDSPTRTRRSAVSAYEKFLEEYPQGAHAEEVRARIAELKQEGTK